MLHRSSGGRVTKCLEARAERHRRALKRPRSANKTTHAGPTRAEAAAHLALSVEEFSLRIAPIVSWERADEPRTTLAELERVRPLLTCTCPETRRALSGSDDPTVAAWVRDLRMLDDEHLLWCDPFHRWTSEDASVYFIQQGTHGPVKIGVAHDVGARRANLQCANPIPLTVWDSCRGGARLEQTLHALFADVCVRGEWFWPTHSLALTANALSDNVPMTAAALIKQAAFYRTEAERAGLV